ncbi:hypothetical protein NliqN6_6644 [Naganishia liquefaciens]|uniref:Uncharacterized protein n=1 Tax=Naganishia liquefaciens TaxID=104408 RepID=A0A8H3U033_9TREE|nr:hypothetical protein NliqN6_6644 [Naganishia liquefaciens]
MNSRQSQDESMQEIPVTAKYPDSDLHRVIMQVFAYVPLTRSFAEEVDNRDLFFRAMYPRALDEKANWDSYLQDHNSQSKEQAQHYVKEASEMIRGIARELENIEDRSKRQAEEYRLAQEVGWLQGAAERVLFELQSWDESHRTLSAKQILGLWQQEEPWKSFNAEREKGIAAWVRSESQRRTHVLANGLYDSASGVSAWLATHPWISTSPTQLTAATDRETLIDSRTGHGSQTSCIQGQKDSFQAQTGTEAAPSGLPNSPRNSTPVSTSPCASMSTQSRFSTIETSPH